LGWKSSGNWIKKATRMGQMLLIPDARPLDQRLGGKFFRKAPRRPGVYLMKDAEDKILYVGKAKDLKQRLGNYRVANPDKMPRRHLRMLNQVSHIELQYCTSETAALKHEAKLIRSLKPKFNRAGVWPGKPRFICWRREGNFLEITGSELPVTGWQRFGPLGSGTSYLQRSIARLLWLAVNPQRPLAELPAGWMRGEFMEKTVIGCGGSVVEVVAALEGFFWQDANGFLLWLGARFSQRVIPFERRVIEAELENLQEFGAKLKPDAKGQNQLALL
jgi:predicted GIY-YIG superfamily endonuclease